MIEIRSRKKRRSTRSHEKKRHAKKTTDESIHEGDEPKSVRISIRQTTHATCYVLIGIDIALQAVKELFI